MIDESPRQRTTFGLSHPTAGQDKRCAQINSRRGHRTRGSDADDGHGRGPRRTLFAAAVAGSGAARYLTTPGDGGDFFWMLHIGLFRARQLQPPADHHDRFAMAWLAVTGFWLLFRTMWRHDFAG